MPDVDTASQMEPDPSVVAEPPLDAPRLGVIPGLIWAYRILEDGTASPLAVDQPIEHSRPGWLWLHLDLTNVPATQWLARAGLPQPAMAMMLSHDRHQQLHAAGSFVYGILADLVCEVHGISEELGYLRFIMTEQLLMTGRHHSLAAVEATRATIQSGATRLTHCASLLELIVEHLADGIDDIADDLAAKLDEIEDQLAVRSIGLARRNLAGVRRTSVRLHRHLSGLRAVLNRLERQGVQTLDPRLQLRAGRLVQRLDELDRAILEIRERGYRLQDEVSATITEETNRHLHLLSILTALLLPPTLVAGVFGMNTKGLPLTEQNSGFVWAMVLVVGSSVVAYIVLRLIGILKPRE
jgi:zinc transporter